MATAQKKPLENSYICFEKGINQCVKAFLKTILGILLVVFNSPPMTFSDILYVLLFHAFLKINYRIEVTRFDVILSCNVKSKLVESIG
jgi:hypothetical protein